MTDEIAGIEQNPAVDEFLEHFGVKGMKWGKHTAQAVAGSTAGRIATAPARQGVRNAQAVGRAGGAVARQGLKNVKTIGGGVKKANTALTNRRHSSYDKLLDKKGELGANVSIGTKGLATALLVSAASKRISNMASDPKTKLGIQAVGGAVAMSVSIGTLGRMSQIDKAANRANDKAGNARGTYVDKAKNR